MSRYEAVNLEAAELASQKVAPPPDVPGERDFARVSARKPWQVACGFRPLFDQQAECRGVLAKLGGGYALPPRLGVGQDYEQDQDGNWVPTARALRRDRQGRPGLGREPRELHGDMLTGWHCPTLPTWILCRKCRQWRRLDGDHLARRQWSTKRQAARATSRGEDQAG